VTTSQREKSQETGIDNNATVTEKEHSAVLVDIETPTSDAVNVEDADKRSGTADAPRPRRRMNWSRVLAFGVLPALALGLAMAQAS
jgi:Mce-associated membrane protein